MNVTLGIVCGLKSEAAAVRKAIQAAGLEPARFLIGVSGADASRAEDIAERFIASGAGALLSIGVSGGLDPALAPGDLLLAQDVQHGGDKARLLHPHDRTLMPSEFWSQYAGGICPVTIYGSDVIIQSAEEKAALFAQSAAVAVDMESHAVAHTAMAHARPFLAIRAIADPASRALPAAALGAVAPDGSTRIVKTLLAMTKAPGDIPALLQLGSDSDKALKALRQRLGGFLGGLLLCLDF